MLIFISKKKMSNEIKFSSGEKRIKIEFDDFRYNGKGKKFKRAFSGNIG